MRVTKLYQIAIFLLIFWICFGCKVCINQKFAKLSSMTQLVHFQHVPNLKKPDYFQLVNSNEIKSFNLLIGEESQPLYVYSQDFLGAESIKKVMKSSIMWYKDYLSPILPPRCRFLPSYSSYGLEAIDKYGPVKGGILTAWRILRCNPFGGSGYDPPIWPPPGYFAGSTTKR